MLRWKCGPKQNTVRVEKQTRVKRTVLASDFLLTGPKRLVQKAKNIEKRVELLLTEEKIDKPARTWHMRIDFGDQPRSGHEVLQLSELAIGYGKTVLLKEINQTLRYGERVAFNWYRMDVERQHY